VPVTAIEDLEELLAQYDADLEFSIASESAWDGQLRLTLTDPPGAPSRSITFYSVGGASPEDVARRLLEDARAWLAESDMKPLPVPEWMFDEGGDEPNESPRSASP
jgi:hypothetical protein